MVPGFPARFELEREGASLVLRWNPAGDGALTLGIGRTPDPSEHTALGHFALGAGRARLKPPGPGRHYVSLVGPEGTLVVAERRVPFAGLINFRDIGGYDTQDGGRTRWGRVFRSDSLHHFTDGDLAAFDALGIETIFDLRRDEERLQAPGPRPNVSMTLPGGRIAGANRAALVDRRSGEQWLLEDYLAMLSCAGAVIGELCTRLAEAAAGPAVIHCWAGKDRTGLAVAILLRALGVPAPTVVEDYALSAAYTPPDRLAEGIELFESEGIPPLAARGMLSSPPWVMAETLEALERDHGGPEAFLTGDGAMSPDALERLRARLVEH